MNICTPDPQLTDVDRLGDEIAELSAHLDAATARLLDLIREFDARGGWNNGFRSCAAWLSWRGGVSPGAARTTRRAGARWAAQREAGDPARQYAGRALHVYQDAGGTVTIRGRLTPEVGALLLKALDAAREALYQRRRAGEPEPDMPTIEQQQADALALLAETALHHGIDPGTPGERYQVVVHVDAAVLADTDQPGQSVLEGGMRVPAGTSQRLACDATRVVMRHDADGRVVEVGARTRTIPPAIRRALQYRDHGCRFPGCGVRFGQGHHIRHWDHGGPTTLSNLTILCRRHHPAVHARGV